MYLAPPPISTGSLQRNVLCCLYEEHVNVHYSRSWLSQFLHLNNSTDLPLISCYFSSFKVFWEMSIHLASLSPCRLFFQAQCRNVNSTSSASEGQPALTSGWLWRICNVFSPASWCQRSRLRTLVRRPEVKGSDLCESTPWPPPPEP